jgi:hypothetical protein
MKSPSIGAEAGKKAEKVSEPKAEKKEEKSMKSASKKTVEKQAEPKADVKLAKEKFEEKLKDANKKLAEKSAELTPKKITTSPKKSPVAEPVKKTTFDFSSKPVKINENPEFWGCKRVNLDKNTEGKRWRYNPTTGLCFEDNDEYTLVATYINGEVCWEVPEEAKQWAIKAGCVITEEDDEDIELEGEFSDEE